MPRLATAADAEELARLRAELEKDIGPWNERLIRFFRDAADSDHAAAFVIGRPGDALVACAAATVTHSVPGPDHDGITAHIHTVYTGPEHRRRGHGRAVMKALLDWLQQRGCTLVTLNASDFGEPLYRGLGFIANQRAMRLIRVPGHRG